MENTIELHWRKASYSGNGGGSCVEVGTGLPGKIAVRDSGAFPRTGSYGCLTLSSWRLVRPPAMADCTEGRVCSCQSTPSFW